MATSVVGRSHTTSAMMIDVGALRLHVLDTGGTAPPMLLLHGLSANADAFGGIIAAGDPNTVRMIAPDLRGRARSDKPARGYDLADHARDVIGLLDALGLERVVLGGHSFGGYLAIYIAAHFPERVTKLLVIDAAISSHPRIGVLLKPSLDRLTHIAPSADAYLAEIRAAPYLGGMWDALIEAYYRAELTVNNDGTAQSATSSSAIVQASLGVATEPLLHLVQQVQQPTLLLNAIGGFGPPGTPPLFDEVVSRATAKAFPDGRYATIPGNHITLLFNGGAAMVRTHIDRFVGESHA